MERSATNTATRSSKAKRILVPTSALPFETDQVQSYKMAGYQLAMDYRTQYTSTSMTLANIDLISNSGRCETDVGLIHPFVLQGYVYCNIWRV